MRWHSETTYIVVLHSLLDSKATLSAISKGGGRIYSPSSL